MLKNELERTHVETGSVRAWWLGGAGFVFKTPAGTQVYVDPYLSNAVAGIFGVERGFPAPIAVEDARPDVVISTHWHEDHLDPGALPVIAKRSNALFICPPSAKSRLLSWGVPRDRVQAIEVGQTQPFRDVTITAMPARHVAGMAGWETPDAVGLILDFGADSVRIYHSGDTEYDVRLRTLVREHVDAAMLVINGAGGNMNAHEAALLAWHIGAPVVIPMHHILWKGSVGGPDATLDPSLFESTYRKLNGLGHVRSLAVGESITFRKRP